MYIQAENFLRVCSRNYKCSAGYIEAFGYMLSGKLASEWSSYLIDNVSENSLKIICTIKMRDD